MINTSSRRHRAATIGVAAVATVFCGLTAPAGALADGGATTTVQPAPAPNIGLSTTQAIWIASIAGLIILLVSAGLLWYDMRESYGLVKDKNLGPAMEHAGASKLTTLLTRRPMGTRGLSRFLFGWMILPSSPSRSSFYSSSTTAATCCGRCWSRSPAPSRHWSGSITVVRLRPRLPTPGPDGAGTADTGGDDGSDGGAAAMPGPVAQTVVEHLNAEHKSLVAKHELLAKQLHDAKSPVQKRQLKDEMRDLNAQITGIEREMRRARRATTND